MVLTRSKTKLIKEHNFKHIITNIIPEDVVNHIRSFLIPLSYKVIKNEYEVVKDESGDFKLMCKTKNKIDLNNFILCWNDIYKTKQYSKFTKYIDSTMLKLLGDKTYKRYFIKWLNSTAVHQHSHDYQSVDDALLAYRFRNHANIISY
jgi:hypothetical protein